MKNVLVVASAVCLGWVSCNKKPSPENPEPPKIDSILSTDAAAAVSQCYEFVQEKDTISLSFTQNGARVKGNLRFDNFEKDSSHGPVEGTIAADTLKLTYTFQSEGATSVREVFFLKSGRTMIMGLGDMRERNGKQVFTNPQGLKYDKSIVLVRTECE